MKPQILYEDDYLLVIDKPAGVVVNRAESIKGETVQDWVEQKLKVQSAKFKVVENSDFVRRAGIVHRLDKETSGVLIVAKTSDAFENLQAQFKERKVEKSYVALVHGCVEPEEGTISAPVGRLPWNRERFGVLPGGREAETRYKVESRKYRVFGNKREEFSLLELYPKTGRTHQIRVHLKSIGHPVVGDMFYAGRKTARHDRQWCPRLFLHAQSIIFQHPSENRKVTVTSPLPEDLSRALKTLSV
ncbi:RluA family pseudouridine synthase [Candidatus Microgenomates bacterium]|nr:RluA family pseudouridine synthase [Candidatus Microgenomates bacterium]